MTERTARVAAPAALALFAALGALMTDRATSVALAAAAVATAVGIVLAWRRVTGWPMIAGLAVAAGALVFLGHEQSSNLSWMGLCVVAAWVALTSATPVAVSAGAVLAVVPVVEWLLDTAEPGWGAWFVGISFTTVLTVFARRLRLTVMQLRAAQDELAERSRAEERNRIAAEVHDVIGHALTVSLLHISGARLALDENPQEARRSLSEAERLTRESLEEVRATVGLMRTDLPDRRTPLPGADDLPALVESFRRAGSDVELLVDDHLGSARSDPRTGGVPDRPGGAHQRHQARTRPAGGGAGRSDPGRYDGDRAQRRATEPGAHPRLRTPRHARAGRKRRRPPDRGADRQRVAGRGGAALMNDAVRVLLVDDQELVRTGLRGILRPRFGFDIVGELDSGERIVETVARLRPHVVVMDVRMPKVDGVTATRLLSDVPGSPPVLVLTTFEDEEILAGALRAGAAGFLLKGVPAEDLQRAVRAVAAGDSWLDPGVTGRVLATYREGVAPALPGPELDVLTQREREVLSLIGAGLSNTEIAGHLVLGEGTVKTHVGHIFAKLDLRDRAAAVVFAFDHGLVQPRRDP